jgi:hypothetical protein
MGFIEAHWHLELMVACPVHRRSAVSTCPKCDERLSWFRPALLECKCGGNLLEAERRSVPMAEASLLDLVRRRVLALQASEENPACLPQVQLMTMNLRSLLAVIRILGKHRIIADGDTGWSNEGRVVSSASRVLADWPTNFIELFSALGRALPASRTSGVGKQFASIYHSLFKSKAISPREQTDFLKVAFLDFANNHWGRGIVDRKLAKQLGASLPKRYLTQTEFAAQIGVEPSTAARLLKNQGVVSTRLRCGMSERILVDTSKSVISRTTPGRILGSREAARRMGLTVSVLQALKQDGTYEVNHLLPTRAGFHELDVEAFIRKLLALAPRSESYGSLNRECRTLQDVMRGHHDCQEVKVAVLRAVLAGKISVVGNADGTPGGLLLESPVYKKIAADARIEAAGDAITPTEVAKVLGCDPGTIPGLVQLGLLQGRELPVGLRVKLESAAAFGRDYIALATIAKNERTSSRAIMRRCGELGISLLLAPTKRLGGPQPFILAADKERLDARDTQTGPSPQRVWNQQCESSRNESAA